MKIRKQDLEPIAEGAAFLGTGGGGDPYIGRLVAEALFERYGEPEMIEASELDDDANVYISAMMGAPTVLVEKIIGGPELDLAISALEKYTGRQADAILPAEMGGCNSMLPLAVAAMRGLPVINADGMGRAFPELQMVSFNVHGVSASPMSMANEHGESIIINARDSHETENKARQLIIGMGGSAAISCYPMSGAKVKQTAIPGTLSLAKGIGESLSQGRKQNKPIDNLVDYLAGTKYYSQARRLFSGKIESISNRVEGGFTLGECHIRGIGEKSQQILTVEFQNENLIARLDGQLIAMVPDLICLVDTDTGTPITTEALKYGQRLCVIAANVPPIMRSEKALNIWGPRAFGYDFDFTPIEKL
ncbi:DUF917 domain-containing protein [Pseudoteredinibacter isoporae]|uniref:DUF917 domain-containing protein n=1 Tax=Pseudoteredinibacter isoporae TaxID=570281 RepID=UPI003109F218